MLGKFFRSSKEAADVKEALQKERSNGAISGGIFGGRLGGEWDEDSDIDVYVNDPKAPYYGDVEFVTGKKSGSIIHVFRKRPGHRGGDSRYEEIQDEAESTGRRLFGR
jgi:hypothetical protein